jgi:Spy/CpxP family protein refolding chaperone
LTLTGRRTRDPIEAEVNMTRVLLVTILALLSAPALAAPAAPATHEQPTPPAAPSQPADRPCHNDMMKFCNAQMGDRDAMHTCMQENHSKFSAECQAAIQARREVRQGQGPGTGKPKGPGGPPTDGG